jgi:uncharacterized protein
MAEMRALFATDLHGSEAAFRKFVNAAAKFKINLLILGGDLTGKTLVPIVHRNGVYRADVMGNEVEVHTEAERAELEHTLRLSGQYTFRCDPDELEFMQANRAEVDTRFEQAMTASVTSWFELAADRLGGGKARVLAMPGNDDPWHIDEKLRDDDYVEWVDDRIVTLDDGTELLGFGASNQTPWASPREYGEDELTTRLRALIERLERPERSIWDVHVPPADSGLDTAVKLTEDLRVVIEGGQTVPVPVGSPAVRSLIEEVQPLLTLHGHIHESPGVVKLGRTTAVNPGSEYTEGILRAAFITVRKGKPIVQLMSA